MWKEEICSQGVSGAKLTDSDQPLWVVSRQNHMTKPDTLKGVEHAEQRHTDWRCRTTCEIPAVEPGRRRRSVLMTSSAECHVELGACGNLSHADHYKFRITYHQVSPLPSWIYYVLICAYNGRGVGCSVWCSTCPSGRDRLVRAS